MKKIFGLVALFIIITYSCYTPIATNKVRQPKLVVGIVIDQMRYDYLYRYWNKYSEGGFKKLLTNGYNCRNTHYNYMPTFTGPGHASIFTGTTPAVHGIIGNNWYNKNTHSGIYCTQDTTVKTVGSETKAGLMSPKNLLVPSIADQLRLASNFKNKSFGIALKDRGAILPAGHSANGAYWFDGKVGKWVTSSHYMENLPTWLNDYNSQDVAAKFIQEPWLPLLPIDNYTESSIDDTDFEEPYSGESHPVFPHNLPAIFKEVGYDLIKATPFGNTITKDFAIETIKQENLGNSGFTDFLSVSFSSPDYIGHQFGPQSVEIEDTYIRLDKDLESFIAFLDGHVGKNEYVLFLTADHGAMYNPSFLTANKFQGGNLDEEEFEKELDSVLDIKFGAGNWIEKFINEQIYFNDSVLISKDVDKEEIGQFVIDFALKKTEFSYGVLTEDLFEDYYSVKMLQLAKTGIFPKRSGDVLLILSNGYLNHGKKGTTHGSPFNYDTHVPLLWYGFGIKSGKDFVKTDITDIAPTIAALCNTQIPDGVTGNCIGRMLK